MAAVVNTPGDSLHIGIYESAAPDVPPRASVIVWDKGTEPVINAILTAETLASAVSEADAALWAWALSGRLGLMAHLVSRPDVWTL